MKSSLGLRDQGYSYMTEGFMEENNICSSSKCTVCCPNLTINDHYYKMQRNPRFRTQTVTAYEHILGTKAGYGTTENQIWQLIFEVEPSWVLEHMGMYNGVKDMFQNFQHDSQNTSWLCHAWNLSHLTQSTQAGYCSH